MTEATDVRFVDNGSKRLVHLTYFLLCTERRAFSAPTFSHLVGSQLFLYVRITAECRKRVNLSIQIFISNRQLPRRSCFTSTILSVEIMVLQQPLSSDAFERAFLTQIRHSLASPLPNTAKLRTRHNTLWIPAAGDPCAHTLGATAHFASGGVTIFPDIVYPRLSCRKRNKQKKERREVRSFR